MMIKLSSKKYSQEGARNPNYGKYKFSPQQASNIKRSYLQDHENLQVLADRYSADPDTIKRCLLREGIQLRTMSEIKLLPLPDISELELRDLHWERNLTIKQIARRIDSTTALVRRLMNKLGIERRKGGYPPGTQDGPLNSQYGKKASAETRQKMSDAHKQNWEDQDYVTNIVEARQVSPNFPERLVDNALQRQNLPFAANMASAVLKVGRRVPDFRSIDGRKIVIEVLGEPFHHPAWGAEDRATPRAMLTHYTTHGFRCVLIWAREVIFMSKAKTLDAWLTRELAHLSN